MTKHKGPPFGDPHNPTKHCDYTSIPPFADASWAKTNPDMCQWCAGTGHPYGDERYGFCKCPDINQHLIP